MRDCIECEPVTEPLLEEVTLTMTHEETATFVHSSLCDCLQCQLRQRAEDLSRRHQFDFSSEPQPARRERPAREDEPVPSKKPKLQVEQTDDDVSIPPPKEIDAMWKTYFKFQKESFKSQRRFQEELKAKYTKPPNEEMMTELRAEMIRLEDEVVRLQDEIDYQEKKAEDNRLILTASQRDTFWARHAWRQAEETASERLKELAQARARAARREQELTEMFNRSQDTLEIVKNGKEHVKKLLALQIKIRTYLNTRIDAMRNFVAFILSGGSLENYIPPPGYKVTWANGRFDLARDFNLTGDQYYPAENPYLALPENDVSSAEIMAALRAGESLEPFRRDIPDPPRTLEELHRAVARDLYREESKEPIEVNSSSDSSDDFNQRGADALYIRLNGRLPSHRRNEIAERRRRRQQAEEEEEREKRWAEYRRRDEEMPWETVPDYSDPVVEERRSIYDIPESESSDEDQDQAQNDGASPDQL